MGNRADHCVCVVNERSGVPKLQPESAANQVQIQRAAPWEFHLRRHVSSLKPARVRNVHRHGREAHVAHLDVEPHALAPRSGEVHVLLAKKCSVAWFSPVAWKRSCFVCRKEVFEHQSRGQPVTADPESISKKTERPLRRLASAVGGRTKGQIVSFQEVSIVIARRLPSKSGARAADATCGVSSVVCKAATFLLLSTRSRPAAVALLFQPFLLPLSSFPFLPLPLSFVRSVNKHGRGSCGSTVFYDIHGLVGHHRVGCEPLALQHQMVPPMTRPSCSSGRNRPSRRRCPLSSCARAWRPLRRKPGTSTKPL